MRNITILLLAVLIGLTIGCGQKPSATLPWSGPEQITGVSDLERLQGVWAVESMDMGDPKWLPPEDVTKSVRFQFQGNRLNMIAKGIWERSSFTLHETVDPKVMTLIQVNDMGEPRKRPMTSEPKKKEQLYKFEGDLLVIAFCEGSDGPRPTEFKARSGNLNPKKPEEYAIVLIKLKKTNEEPKTDPGPQKMPAFTNRGTSR